MKINAVIKHSIRRPRSFGAIQLTLHARRFSFLMTSDLSPSEEYYLVMCENTTSDQKCWTWVGRSSKTITRPEKVRRVSCEQQLSWSVEAIRVFQTCACGTCCFVSRGQRLQSAVLRAVAWLCSRVLSRWTRFIFPCCFSCFPMMSSFLRD